MNDIFFTSDQHLDHYNPKSGRGIISIMGRPFSSIEEMQEEIISCHNAIVKPGDIVYNLGDFAPSGGYDLFVPRLNGQQHLIKGNHDYRRELKKLRVGGKGHFQSIQDVLFVRAGEIEIFLSHFAHRTWNKSHYGSWHLYGHSHGMIPDFGRSTDVGVDAWDFTPVSIDQLKERFKDRETVNHHPESNEDK